MGMEDKLRKFVAGKVLLLKGKTYQKDEEVDVSGLAEYKLSQFLNQRLLKPKPPAG